MPSRLSLSRGFSLIEMSIVLLIAGLLIAGVFSVTSNMQKQRADQATANEVRTVITALERYLVDNQSALTASTTTNNISCTIPACATTPAKQLLNNITVVGHTGNEQTYFQTNYLPGGTNFDLSAYQIGIANYGPITTSTNTNGGLNLRGLVIRAPASTADDGRLGRIAALIGSQGGMIPAAATVTGGGYPVTGVYGAWGVNTATYAIPAGNTAVSQIAAYTATVDSQINTNLLSRINTGNPEANTMETNLVVASPSSTMTSNDILTNNGIGSPANAATTYQNKLLNAGGLGFMVTNAVLGVTCYSATAPFPADLVVYDPTGSNAIGALSLSAANTTATYNITPQNLVVFGSSNATTLGPGGYSGNGSIPTLLQCEDTSTGWFWKLALPPPTANPTNFNNSGARVKEKAVPSISTNRTVNISNCGTYDLYLFIDQNSPPTCGAGIVDVNAFASGYPNPTDGALLVGKISPGAASSFIVPAGYSYYASSQGLGGLGTICNPASATPTCQWVEYK